VNINVWMVYLTNAAKTTLGKDNQRPAVRGGATILKVRGTKRDSRAKKNFVPPTFGKVGVHFFPCGGMTKQITISIEYTEICCLVVALINMS